MDQINKISAYPKKNNGIFEKTNTDYAVLEIHLTGIFAQIQLFPSQILA